MDSRPIYIAPSILSANFAYLKQEMDAITKGGADMAHLDVMDGHFVNNLTFGPCVVKAIHAVSQIPLDVHLMIAHPEKYVDAFLDAGSHWLTFHIEATDQPQKLIDTIKNRGVKACIAIKPATSTESIKNFIKDLDMILVMSVEPGFGGQKFMPEVLNKVRELRQLEHCPNDIEIDGGINEETAQEAVAAGVNVLVAGSYVFKGGNPKEKIDILRKKTQN